MTITLPREQQEWLERLVKAGAFSSVEEAVVSILFQHMDPNLDLDDLDWAKPLVEEGRRSLEQGGLTLAEYRRRIDEKLESLRRR